ncbi:MAG: acyl-CoA dehydrogenase [Planctomycetota bacterium]|jgi:acyl-CoA dehydrogenase
MQKSPWMTDELQMFRDAVRKFVDAEMAPHDERWRKQQHIDAEFWLKAGEMGFLCTDIPDVYGGVGADFRYEVVLYEETWGRGFTSWGQMVHSIMANYLLRHGNEDQKKHFLPRMASGELVGAIAMTEPGAGSDLQSIRTRADRKGDEYVINGSKTFITNGYLGGLIGVVCKTDPNERAKGISILLVETKDLPGFRVGRILDKIGQKGQDTCELFFDDVHVPAANLLGDDEGRGFFQLMSDLPYERTLIAVCGVAAMENALALTIEYTKERKAFGKTLFDLQTTKHKLAELKTITHIARVFIDDCVQKVLSGELDSTTASMAKWWVTDMQCKVMDECLQLHGGYGYMTEYPISQFYTDARVQKIYAGANEIMKELIARSL